MSNELIELTDTELVEISDTELEIIELAEPGPQGPAGVANGDAVVFAIVFGG